jgi:RND superfamily putative drug exporter
VVLAFWIAVFAVAGPLAGKLNSAQQNDSSAWLPHNAESTQVVDLAKRFSPSDVFPALVVYERADGPVTPADQAKVAADVQRFAAVKDVSGNVLGPIPSEDGRALQVVVPIRVAEEGNGWEELAPRIEELRSIAQADTGGLGVYVTGPAGYFADFSKVFSGFDSTLLYITAAIVIVILLLTYRSPVLWLLPLTTVFVALTAAQAVIYLLARNGGLTVNARARSS